MTPIFGIAGFLAVMVVGGYLVAKRQPGRPMILLGVTCLVLALGAVGLTAWAFFRYGHHINIWSAAMAILALVAAIYNLRGQLGKARTP